MPAEREVYVLEVTVDTAQGQARLKALDKFLEQSRRRAEILGRIKASPAARLDDRVSGPLRRIESGLRRVASTPWSVAVRIKDFATGTLDRIRRGLFSFQSMAMMALGGLGVGKLWDATVGYAAKMEEASVAFETMLGSRDKVTSFLKDLED
ncbi:MAG: hypothetical protein AB1816_00155, partial [Bacillota bacterium]